MSEVVHFNKLTPAQAERLAMLAEEAGEVIQIVGKILRHGYDSYHPDDPLVPNRHMLVSEITDFMAIVWLAVERGDIPEIGQLDTSIMNKMRYAHHQE